MDMQLQPRVHQADMRYLQVNIHGEIEMLKYFQVQRHFS